MLQSCRFLIDFFVSYTTTVSVNQNQDLQKIFQIRETVRVGVRLGNEGRTECTTGYQISAHHRTPGHSIHRSGFDYFCEA